VDGMIHNGNQMKFNFIELVIYILLCQALALFPFLCYSFHVILPCCFKTGKWQYEVMLGSKGIMQLGWCTSDCKFTPEVRFIYSEEWTLGVRSLIPFSGYNSF
jgi:hypothetical protein